METVGGVGGFEEEGRGVVYSWALEGEERILGGVRSLAVFLFCLFLFLVLGVGSSGASSL